MLSDLSDILEIIQFFHQDNPIIRSKAFICKDYKQVIIGVNMSEEICKGCGYKLTAPPSEADNWTCPVCGHKNGIGDAGTGDNWLDGLCHYSGPGHDLPLGGYTKIPGFKPESMAQTWLVATGDGLTAKKTKDLTTSDVIVGVVMNPESIAAIIATYGEDFYQIREANGGPLLTLSQWQKMFGTNGLGLVAIRNMRLKLQGQGVHF